MNSIQLMKRSQAAKDGPLFGPDELFWTHFGTTHPKFEFLRRLARKSTKNSTNRAIDVLFPRTWRKDLEDMRDEQRKLGIPDHEFFHAVVQRRLGVPYVAPGRRKRKPT